MQSPRFSLNASDEQVILTIIVHGLVGILLTLISTLFLHWNYGYYTPIVTTALSLISASLTKYVSGPSQSSLTIAQLQQQITVLTPPPPPSDVPPTPQNNATQ